MDLKTANLLKDAADDLGIEIKVYEDYSGRSMYGRTTTGLVLKDPLKLIVVAVHAAEDILAEGSLGDLAQLRSDSMGLDMIVY